MPTISFFFSILAISFSSAPTEMWRGLVIFAFFGDDRSFFFLQLHEPCAQKPPRFTWSVGRCKRVHACARQEVKILSNLEQKHACKVQCIQKWHSNWTSQKKIMILACGHLTVSIVVVVVVIGDRTAFVRMHESQFATVATSEWRKKRSEYENENMSESITHHNSCARFKCWSRRCTQSHSQIYFDDHDDNNNSNIRPTPVDSCNNPFHSFFCAKWKKKRKNVRSRRLTAIFHFVIQFQLAAASHLRCILIDICLPFSVHSHLSRQLLASHALRLPSPTNCLRTY